MPTTFANSINNNLIYADRAEHDAAGNDIATTYATKSELPSVPVTDVEVDGVSVVSSGVASITTPTVDQAYNSSSTNAQSGTAVAGAIAGVNQVPASTSSDADKVLTVDSQGVPGWATAQAPISAGDGISITNNVVSAKVDGTTIDMNASGELTVIGGGGGGVQADWTEDDPTDPSYIENKPTPKTLTAGTNITITESSSTLTVAATWQNAQADWTENDPNEPAYIQHKPTIPSGNQLVPAATSADEGKCLVVDSNGDPEWGTGGKTYTGTDGVVVDNVNDTVGLEAPVDIVAGPGIVVDNPDGNTVRISVAQSQFTELYYNATNTNDTAGKVYQLSEPITNFAYAKITVDNMEFTNTPLVYEIDVQHNTTSCNWYSPLRNANINNTINLPACNLQINSDGNLVLQARGLTYNTYPSPQFTNGDSRGFRVVRVVGIFRITGGN